MSCGRDDTDHAWNWGGRHGDFDSRQNWRSDYGTQDWHSGGGANNNQHKTASAGIIMIIIIVYPIICNNLYNYERTKNLKIK